MSRERREYPRALQNNKYLDTLTSGLKHRKEAPRAKMKGAVNQTLYPYWLLAKLGLILD